MQPLPVALRADGGAAATGPDFFRSEHFLAAEGVTHSLVVGDGLAVFPVILREVDGGGTDAVSPYGYPGGCLRGAPLDAADIDFAGSGLISLFVRERLGAPTLRGGTVQSVVRVHDPARPREVNPRIRTKARGNERRGYRFEWFSGGSVPDEMVRAFERAYVETMRRVGAVDHYYFGLDYLRTCLSVPSSNLALVRGPEGDFAAAAIAVVSDGCLHSFLTCTAKAHLRSSPAKNVVLGMMDRAEEAGLPLNLGGGLIGQDSLYDFKARFTNSSWQFVTHRVVCAPETYARLSAGRRESAYFPAYRAPGGAAGSEQTRGTLMSRVQLAPRVSDLESSREGHR
ncbi:MAG: GNAT family N-acetyltransferase [Pseudonocardia sp.]